MATNQTTSSKLEQRSVTKCLVAEKCKLRQMYRRIFDVYIETCFSQKMFLNRLNMGLLVYKPEWKKKSLRSRGIEYPVKKNFRAQR